MAEDGAVSDQDVIDAAARATDAYSLCPHRVWAVARNHPDGERALPHLFPEGDTALHDLFTTTHVGVDYDDDNAHRGCTFEFCEQSQLNFTSVSQRHESPSCQTSPCARLQGLFPFAKLNQAARTGAATAWQLSGRVTVVASQTYLAISHVWSDGTGAGTWPAGEVNTCLYHFFAYIARRYKCDGIWWDAICIPSDKVARAKAIANMHINYSKASLTFVHDCFLRGIAFRDPETACIAVIMSPWFSRGWTAVELANSKNVVIAFKGTLTRPTLVNLDDLLKEPQTARHKVAAEAISMLRTGNITNLNRLLGILATRYTSWTKDIPIISALLVGAEVTPSHAGQENEQAGNLFQQDIYRRVIVEMRRIGHAHLFHNLPTVSRGSSWCPARLLDLPPAFTENFLQTDRHGNLIGCWLVVPVESVPAGHLLFADAHPLVKARIRAGLRTPMHHRFLLEPGQSSVRRAVLARKREHSASHACYQFIGSVIIQPAHGGIQKLVPRDVLICYDGNATYADIEGARNTDSVTASPPTKVSPHEAFKEEIHESAIGSGALSLIDEDRFHASRFTASNRTFYLQRPLFDDPNEVIPPFPEDVEYLYLPRSSSKILGPDPRYELIRMAIKGNASDVARLIYQHPSTRDHFICDEDGRTALSWAAGEGHAPTINTLLESLRFCAIRDVLSPNQPRESAINTRAKAFRRICNAMDDDARTPLAWAAAEGRAEAVTALLRYPDVEIDARDRARWTPLWYAANNSYTKIMQHLIDAGADKTQRDKSGVCLIEAVARDGTVPAMKVLLKSPVDPDDVNCALTRACYQGNVEIVKLLVNTGGDAVSIDDRSGLSPFHAAISHGHNDIVQWLMTATAIDLRTVGSMSKFQRTPERDSLLCLAIEYKNPLFGEIDPTANISGYLPIIKMLLNTQLFDHQSALHLAASLGDHVVVQLLLEAGGVDVNARCEAYNDASALYYAALRGHRKVVETLLQVDGVDCTIAATCLAPKYGGYDKYKQTPLQAAVGQEHQEVAAVIREHAKKNKPTLLRKLLGSS